MVCKAQHPIAGDFTPSYGISFIRLGKMRASRPISTLFGHRPVLRSSRENHFPINWEYGNTALLSVTVWLCKFLIDSTENLDQISLNMSLTPLLQQFKTDSTGTSIHVQNLYFNSSKLTALGPQSKSNTFTSTLQNWQHWDLNPRTTPLLQQFKTDSTGTSNQVQHLYFNSSKLTALGPQTMSDTFTSTVQNWQHQDLNPCPTPLLQQFKTDSTRTSIHVQHLYFNCSKLTALGPQTKSNTFTSTNRQHWDLNPSPTPLL